MWLCKLASEQNISQQERTFVWTTDRHVKGESIHSIRPKGDYR